MRWRGGRRSDNIEDRRGQSAGGGGFGGLGSGRGRIPIRLPRGRRGKLGGLGLLVVIGIALFLGVDPMVLLQGGGMPQMGQQPAPQTQARRTAPQDEMAQFVSVVLADTEDTWHALFRNANRSYKEPKLVLFTGAVNSACGFAQAAMGPFYCPGDQKVYIDLGFFADLRQRFRAPGDFAQAYVIAHEVGHHVQTLLGISRKVHELRGKVSKSEGNKLSVRQELQADCFAGVWAHNADKARKILEKGDIDEALNAVARRLEAHAVVAGGGHDLASGREKVSDLLDVARKPVDASYQCVMAGLVPAIHVVRPARSFRGCPGQTHCCPV